MTKNHGLNLVILLIWAAITLGGLGVAASKVEPFYWFPFAVNTVIAVILGIKEGIKARTGENA